MVDLEWLDLGRGRKVTIFLKKRSTEEIYGQTEQDQLALLSVSFPGETKRKRFTVSETVHQKRQRFGEAKKKKKTKQNDTVLFSFGV